MKRKRTFPFRLVKAKTGRYNMRTTDRALELRAKDPALWRKLPAQLRREAEEAEKLAAEAVARWPEVQRAARELLEKIHPKLRALAKVVPAIADLEIPELLENPAWDAVADYLKVPGHRGRWPDKKTAELRRRVRQGFAEGKKLYRIARELGIPYNRLRAFISDQGISRRR
jgi:hypothetical protein